MFFDFEQHKHLYMIQKENMGPLIFEVWNKNIFSFVAKLLFAPSRQMKRLLAILVSDTKLRGGAVYWPYKYPVNNDQFTRNMNINVAIDALTYQMELKLREFKNANYLFCIYLMIKFQNYLANNNNNNKNHTAIIEN